MTFPQCTNKVSSPTGLGQGRWIFADGVQGQRLWLWLIGLCWILFGLWGCAATAAPREFAPDGTVIQGAIATKLQIHYQQLSQTLDASPPTLELKNIQVKKLDSFFLQRLPVYHLQGTYDVVLKFSSQRLETRHQNPFDIYLQRQPEGKTWRSLEKNSQGWRSQQLSF